MIFSLYKAALLLGYVYLSAALLFRARVKRWVTFSAAYLALYLVGTAVFFTNQVRPSVDLPALITLATVLGIAGVVGWGLAHDRSLDWMLGNSILYLVLLMIVLAGLHALLGRTPVQLPWLFPAGNP